MPSCIMHIRQRARRGLLVNTFYSRGVASNLISALAIVFGSPEFNFGPSFK